MTVILYIVIALIWIFGLVVFVGAPYLPTLKRQYKQAIDLMDLKRGQTILELGCGDGRVAKYAAQQGLKVVGYELNYILVLIARVNNWRYRKQVKIIWGNYWNKSWPKAEGIFVFLLPTYMEELDKKINQYAYKPVVLASVAFKIESKKAILEKDGLFIYRYSK